MSAAEVLELPAEHPTDVDAPILALDLASCPITHVTVFNDRAEVSRRVEFTPSATGEVGILCTGLVQQADTESLRVSRVRGKCTILEVAFDTHTKVCEPDQEESRERAKQVASHKSEVARLESSIRDSESEKNRLAETRKFVEAYLGSLVKGENGASRSIEDVNKALTFFRESAAEVDQGMAKCDQQIKSLKASLAAVKADCVQDGNSPYTTTKQSRDVTVLVDVRNVETVELQLVYMVNGASWEPSYDIRVSTSDIGAPALSLSYFALVKQLTGEDWSGCGLSLSTVIPSKGGTPQIPKRKVIRYSTGGPVRLQNESLSSTRMGSNFALAPQMMQQQQMAPQMMQQQPMAPQMLSNVLMAPQMVSSPDNAGERQGEEQEPQAAHAGVSDTGVGNVTFTIERKVQIKAGNKPHKVTIAVSEFVPRFQHFAVPEQEERVYLQVRTTNDSAFKLLASSKVSVFFNGSFVTTTRILDTSPGEEINTFLGHDGAVKVEYRRIKSKDTEQSGFMSAKTRSTTNESRIVVTNTKKIPVSVKIVGLIPRSGVEQIAVQLTKPAPGELVSEGDARGENATMQNTVTNNIVWIRQLAAGQKLELPIQYTVTWPLDKKIDITDA
jgi:uncharacterized protein (TIGR02231 family)